MFIYEDTKKVSKSGELQRKVVTHVRKVMYLNDSKDPKVSEPVTSYGQEIVKEMVVSPEATLTLPIVVESKTVDNRNPNRVVDKRYIKKN